jgi:intracellular multiplication protein IcmN
MFPFYDIDGIGADSLKSTLVKNKWISFCILTLLFLSSCQSQQKPLTELDESLLPTSVAGASDAQILFLQKRLHQKNIKIVNMGDEYLISIPATLIFADQSPKIQWKSYGLLNEIACYLRQYRKVAVQVTTYVSPYGSERRQMALSVARSEAISNYLWSQGIDGRLIVAHGQGSQKPVVVKNPPVDQAQNARIEITFRRVEA